MHILQKKIILLVFISFPLLLFSQEKSIPEALANEIVKNTDKFSPDGDFLKARQFFIEEKWDSTLATTSKILDLAQNHSTQIEYCHFFRGVSFFHKELYKEAETELLKIPSTFVFHPNVLAKLGHIEFKKPDFKKALSYYKLFLVYVNEQNYFAENDLPIIDKMGLCHLHLKQYGPAQEYLLQSAKRQLKNKDTLGIIGAYQNLATLYYNQYQDDKAIPIFKTAYILAKTTNDFDAKLNTSKNMAIVEENRKDYPKSIRYYKEQIQWKDSIHNQNKIFAVAQAEKKTAAEKKEKELAILKAANEVKAAQNKTYLYSGIILVVMLGVSLYLYREKVKYQKIINAQRKDLDH